MDGRSLQLRDWFFRFLRLLEGRVDSNITNRDLEGIFAANLVIARILASSDALLRRADACQIVIVERY